MTKRVVITSILGLICGCISWVVCKYGFGHSQPLVTNALIILQNGLMGFTIGISSLRWPWAIHGLVLGGMFGFVLGIGALALGSEFIWPFVFGLVYGFIIELITTVFFKAGMAEPKQ